jgi:hypothetical protein
MPETFAALLLAHVLADFVFQSNWMVAQKQRAPAMAAHVAVVGATLIAATGTLHPLLLALTLAHLGIDLVKTHAGRKGLAAFLADQAAHLGTLALAAWAAPELWAQGLWQHATPLPALMALTAGLILTTRAGGMAVGMLMAPWAASTPEGLTGGGKAIGLLERGLIFLLILTGQAGGIGFLIAAKSVLRFGTVADDRKVSEYVIIGTLASFAWAIAMAFATLALLALLPPLGIPDLSA